MLGLEGRQLGILHPLKLSFKHKSEIKASELNKRQRKSVIRLALQKNTKGSSSHWIEWYQIAIWIHTNKQWAPEIVNIWVNVKISIIFFSFLLLNFEKLYKRIIITMYWWIIIYTDTIYRLIIITQRGKGDILEQLSTFCWN